jgi:hypothetical protein
MAQGREWILERVEDFEVVALSDGHSVFAWHAKLDLGRV